MSYPRASQCPSFICDNHTINNIPERKGQLYHDATRVTAELVIVKDGELKSGHPGKIISLSLCICVVSIQNNFIN